MSAIGQSLQTVFDFTWERFTDRLAGLGDEEYFWEPAAGGWTLRRDESGVWRLDGDGGGGPAPDSVPVTTIAWRIGHLGLLTLRGFTARLFGEESVAGAPMDEPLPAAGDAALPYLEAGYQAWRAGMASLDDVGWWSALGPDWEPYQDSNRVDLALHMLDELVHHAAEVALLRDLWAARAAAGAG